MGRSRGKKRKEKGKSYRGNHSRGEKLGIKEKGEEEGCMGRKVHIGNKWWKIMTIYSKEVKTTRRRVEDPMKENREDRILLGGDYNGRIGEKGQEIGKRREGMGNENPKTRWKLDGRIEGEQTRGRRRGMDLSR
jgi:hypothetical protein